MRPEGVVKEPFLTSRCHHAIVCIDAHLSPNSDTFTAYIAREVPELGLDLPSNAVGKDLGLES